MTAIDDINEGVYDGKLGDVIQAVFERIAQTESTFSWRITLEGDTWDVESVSLRELAYAETVSTTTSSYLTLDPTRHMDHLVALIVAHFKITDGMKLEAALEKAGKYTASDLKNIVSLYEVGAVGKGGGGTSTDS